HTSMNINSLKSKIYLYTLIAALISLPLSEIGTQNPAPHTKSVLTIGNSFADNAATFLSQIAESVPGYTIEITKANIGGCSLEKHAALIGECRKNPDLKPYYQKYCLQELLTMKDYDVVTIQQVSHLSIHADSFEPFAHELIDFIRKNAEESEIKVHQIWAYGPGSDRLEKWEMTREEMQSRLVQNYTDLASRYNLDILPSGNAFYTAFEKNPKLDLWSRDRYHANPNGCYLAGCVWFGELFGISPKKIQFVPDGMEPKTAKFLRKMAAKVVNNQ